MKRKRIFSRAYGTDPAGAPFPSNKLLGFPAINCWARSLAISVTRLARSPRERRLSLAVGFNPRWYEEIEARRVSDA